MFVHEAGRGRGDSEGGWGIGERGRCEEEVV